jgi:membrane fusion protein, multidrug efflux system
MGVFKRHGLFRMVMDPFAQRKKLSIGALGLGNVAPMGLLVVFSVGLLWACSSGSSGNLGAQEQKKKAPVPVTASEAVEKSIPVQLRVIGNVQAYASVNILCQIAGELTTVHFKEGQEVRKGDPLFTIDPRPFEARLKQAEANLARDRAQLQNAKKQADRYGSVVKKGYVAEEQYDQMAANAAALEGTVKADEAAVENAKLELKYCFIKSPLNGYVGNIKLDAGNVVKANDTEKPMASINQVSPIYVSFSVPEKSLAEIKSYMASHKLEVRAAVSGGDVWARGELSFIDNTVDRATGTIQLKGTFPNEDKALWPGQFVNVVLTLTTLPGVLVVPSHAVQTGQQGQFVYVVKADLTVDYRPVIVGRSIDGETVIEKGVRSGERVVTDGHLRLAPGTLVKLMEANEKG